MGCCRMGAKVLVVSDNRSAVTIAERSLVAPEYELVVATSGTTALGECSRAHPDAVLADLSLPDMAGVDLCRRLRKLTYAPIIAMTHRDDEVEGIVALEIGADNLLFTPLSRAVLSATVRAVLRRSRVRTARERAEPLRAGPIVVDKEGRTARVDDKPVALSPKEFDLLELLVARPGRVLSKSFLLERVWNMPSGRDDRTIAVHMARLRKKIGDHRRRRRLIATVPGVGYVLRCDDGRQPRKAGRDGRAARQRDMVPDGL
jgi:DNA-binding response OmpR family regulator